MLSGSAIVESLTFNQVGADQHTSSRLLFGGHTLTIVSGLVTLDTRANISQTSAEACYLDAGANALNLNATRGAVSVAVILKGSALRKTGGQTVTLFNPFDDPSETYTGDTFVEVGSLVVRNGKIPPATRVEVWPARTVQFNEFTTVAGVRDRPGFGGGSVKLNDTERWYANPRLVVDVQAGATNTFSGSVVPSTSFGRDFRKSGAGRQILSGSFTSQRLIEVDGGQLAIDGTVGPSPYPNGEKKYSDNASELMEGRFFIRSSGMLSGTGTIQRAVIFQSGGALHSALNNAAGLTVAAPLTIGSGVTLALDRIDKGVLLTYTDTRSGEFAAVNVNGAPAQLAGYRIEYGPEAGGGTIAIRPSGGTVMLVR